MKNKTNNTRERWGLHSPDNLAAPTFFTKPTDHIHTILNRLISKKDFGVKWQGKPIHCNTKEELLKLYTGRLKDRYGRHQHWLGSITVEKWDRHFRNQDTFYFTGNPYAPYTLVMIDIDCHTKGTYAGAVNCAQFLKDHFFPGLFFEPSTNLNGVHGYFVLRSAGMTPDEVNAWESQLQTALQTIQHQFDIELIEIKGHCHVVETLERRVMNVKCGTLAKCPRTARERKDEFLATTLVDPQTFIMPQPHIHPPAVLPLPKNSPAQGSTSGHCIQDWRHLLPLAKQMLGDKKRKVVGDVRVTAEDVAILLAITYYCSEHMNEDGSMPTARIRGFWDTLHQNGETARAFIPRRYKATRDFLDAARCIDWKSNHYALGIACKWQLNEETMAIIASYCSQEDEKGTSFVSSKPWVLKPEELITRPVRAEERLILYEEVEEAMGWRTAA